MGLLFSDEINPSVPPHGIHATDKVHKDTLIDVLGSENLHKAGVLVAVQEVPAPVCDAATHEGEPCQLERRRPGSDHTLLLSQKGQKE